MGKIRDAMLDAAARWHDEADKQLSQDNMTGRTIAVVIAEALTQEANRYKNGDGDVEDKQTDTRALVDEDPSLAADEARWDDMRLEEITDDRQRSMWDDVDKM